MKKLILSILVLFSVFIVVGCESKTPDETDKGEEVDVKLEDLAYFNYLNDENPVITIKVKDYGIITAQLFPDVAPNTVNNFIDYILDDQFSDSSFHRIIKDFMVQGGMVKDSKLPIRGEFTSNGFLNNLKHTYGVLSMARTSDKNSATSQFFMMTSTSPHLDGAYASFGGIISGFTILNQIESLSTNSNDAPLTKVVIESIEVDLKNYEPSPVIYYSK